MTDTKENEQDAISKAASVLGRKGAKINAEKQLKRDPNYFKKIGKLGGEKVKAAFAEKQRSHHKKQTE